MANNERLTKRVKKMEEWIASNEGGPTLNNFNWLIEVISSNDRRMGEMDRQHTMFRELFQEFMHIKELADDWDEFLKEKDNAQKTDEESPEEEEE